MNQQMNELNNIISELEEENMILKMDMQILQAKLEEIQNIVNAVTFVEEN